MPNAFDELEAAPKKRNVFDELESPRRNVFDELEEIFASQGEPEPLSTPAEDRATLENYLRATTPRDDRFRQPQDLLKQPDVLGVFGGDREPMTRDNLGRVGSSIVDSLAQGGIGLQEGFKSLGEQVWTGIQAANEPILELGPISVTASGIQPTALARSKAEGAREIAKEATRGSEDLAQLSKETGGSQFMRQLGQGIPSVAPAIAAGPLGLPAVIGAAGAQGGLSTLAQAQDVFEQDPEERGGALLPNPAFRSALAPAAADAIQTAAITLVAGKLFGQGIEGATLPVKRAAIQRMVGGKLREALGEAVEEGVQQLISDAVIKRMSYDPEASLEEAISGALDAAAVGGVLGAGVSTIRDAGERSTSKLPPTFAEWNREQRGIARDAARAEPEIDEPSLRIGDSEINRESVGNMTPEEYYETSSKWASDAMAGNGLSVQVQAEVAALRDGNLAEWVAQRDKADAEAKAVRDEVRKNPASIGDPAVQKRYGGAAQKVQFFNEGIKVLEGKPPEPATVAELKRIEQEGASLSQGQPLTDETPYEIFDTQTGEVVFEGLYKNRSRIRQAAEQRNKNYGAYRYAPRVKPVIGQDASLSQSESAPVHELSEPPSRQELESKVKELRQKHPGMLEIRIADDYHGLPDRAHQAAYRQGANPAGIKGFVDGKTVWLNRQMLDSVEDAIATIWHEQFGHFATDKKLGRRLTRFMSQVRESFRDTELMRDIESRYRNADDVRLGREFVARIAENPNSNPGAWKRLVAMVRQWLRDIGFVKTVTENDIQALLRGAIDSLAAQESGVEPSLSVKSTKSDLPISTPENIGETSEMPPSPGEKTKPSRGKWFAGKNPVETAAMMQERANAFQKGKSDQQIIEDLAGWMSGNPNINLDSEAANFVIKDMLAKIGKSINPKQSTPQTMEKWAQIDRLSEMARRVGEQSGRELVSRRLAFNDINWLMPLLSWRGLAQKTWRKALGIEDGKTPEAITQEASDEATKDAADTVQDEFEINDAEKSAQRIIKQLATSQSDTLKWPKKTIDGVRETVKWFILGDITEAEFQATMNTLKVEPFTSDILISTAKREQEIVEGWNRRKSKEKQERRQNQMEMRNLRARAMIALRTGMEPERQAEVVLNQFIRAQQDTPPSEMPKRINEVRAVVKGFLEGDITEAELDASLETMGISETLRARLISTANRELETRKHYELLREQEKADQFINEKVFSELNRVARGADINWSELFLDNPRATQEERREHLFAAIRNHPRLKKLNTEQARRLEKALADAWQQARLNIFRREFAKRIKLPTIEAEKKIDKALPELIRQGNLGTLDMEAFLRAFAKEMGLPSLSGETATKLVELGQKAQATPEGILRNKILQQMVDEIQRTTPASPFDIIRDYWYNNALSGSRTLAAILTGSWIHGAIMATQEAADAALQGNFKAARYIPLAFMLDTFEGIANAVDVIRTGDYTRRAEFAENIQRALGQKGKLDSLEGWWKHGNKLQKALALTTFVRRAVVGLDYIGAIATRGSGVIYNALLESPQQLEQALKRFDKEASAQAKKQAQAELGPKAKWVDVRARQLEILEQGINQEIKENAKTLGEIAALNAPPVGLGAVAYKALEYIPRAIQSNFRISKEAAQFAGFVGRAATGLAFARAAINMAANASNWMPLVGGINWGRALVGKRIPQEHWARVFGLYDEKGEPLSDDRRRLIFASHAMGLALVASVYALTQLGDDDDEKRFDVQGTWKGLSAKERKAKIDAGLRPLSIQVGGKTIRYDNLPMASALAVVGNIRDKERKDGKRMTLDDAITRITDGWASGIFYIKDLTPIQGFVDALGYSSMNTDEGADAINRWASQFARSGAALIPFASAQREIDTFFDPSHYKPRRSIDYWVRSIPWVRRYGGVGPEYNMAGLPIENPLWPSTRFIPADLPDDPVVDALSSLVARGVFPKHPDPSPTWIKDGERRSASEFPKETYRFQTEVLKAWRREMLRDAELLKKFTADEYEDYYRRYLAPLTQQIKAEIQNEIDPEALDYRGRVRQDYLKP